MQVFVYGTLTDESRAAAVLDDCSFSGPARLDGLHRVDGRYPTLAPGGAVDGRVLETDDAEALDAYEGVEGGLYARVTVPTADGGTVEAYVGDPRRLGVDGDVEWPGDGPFEARVRAYVAGADVVVRRRE